MFNNMTESVGISSSVFSEKSLNTVVNESKDNSSVQQSHQAQSSRILPEGFDVPIKDIKLSEFSGKMEDWRQWCKEVLVVLDYHGLKDYLQPKYVEELRKENKLTVRDMNQLKKLKLILLQACKGDAGKMLSNLADTADSVMMWEALTSRYNVNRDTV